MNRIHQLYIIFSREDFYLPRLPGSQRHERGRSLHDFCDEWLLFMEYPSLQTPWGESFNYLCDAWIGKLHMLRWWSKPANFNITLDLKDAYGPDGTWLGNRIAVCCLSSSTYITIEAPLRELEREIYQFFKTMEGIPGVDYQKREAAVNTFIKNDKLPNHQPLSP